MAVVDYHVHSDETVLPRGQAERKRMDILYGYRNMCHSLLPTTSLCLEVLISLAWQPPSVAPRLMEKTADKKPDVGEV